MKATIRVGFTIEVPSEEYAELLAEQMIEGLTEGFEIEANFQDLDTEEMEEKGIIEVAEPLIEYED